MNNKEISTLENALLGMDRLGLESLVNKVLTTEPPIVLFDRYLTPAMERIGLKWEAGETSLAQVYMAGRMCEHIADTIAGELDKTADAVQTVSITVLDDYHVLGKQVVSAFLRGAGYSVIDYGRTSVTELTERVILEKPTILLISVLMLPSALEIKTAAAQIREALSSPPKIIVGGAPFRLDKNLWKEVGADAVGNNAGDAIRLVREFFSGGTP